MTHNPGPDHATGEKAFHAIFGNGLTLKDGQMQAQDFSQPRVTTRALIDPSRKCSLRCEFCVTEDTPILMADMTWKPIGEVMIDDDIIGFNRDSLISPEKVVAMGMRDAPVFNVTTEHGTIRATAEHPWLNNAGHWCQTTKLVPGTHRGKIRHIATPTVSTPEDDDYKAGYVAGLIDGDGCIGQSVQKGRWPVRWCSVRMRDIEPVQRLIDYYKHFGVECELTTAKHTYKGEPYLLHRAEFRDKKRIAKVNVIIQYRKGKSFAAGWLAGMFDSEGSLCRVLRISSASPRMLRNVIRFAKMLGFEMVLEEMSARLTGGVPEIMRFFALCRPALTRKRNKLHGTKRLNNSTVKAVEPAGIARVVNLQTTSGTYWAAGFASHNCYYLPNSDLSSVQDWDTQKKQVLDAVARGCTAADLSGGEPLQNPDVVRLVQLCTDSGLPVRIISSLICPEKVLDDVLDAGVDDWLVSLHGAKEETHNDIVKVPKARQLQIRRIAKIAARMDWCANYVLVEKNQTEMADLARWLVSLDRPPKILNYINFNAFGPWLKSPEWIEKGKANVVDLRIAGPILDEAIDILEAAGIGVNLRYLPMCTVAERHRKSVCNDFHVAFDQGEWDSGFVHSAEERTLEVGERYAKNINRTNELQTAPCSGCGLHKICGGANRIWHQLAMEKFGTETLTQIALPDGVDPNNYWHYRQHNVLGLDPRRPKEPVQ